MTEMIFMVLPHLGAKRKGDRIHKASLILDPKIQCGHELIFIDTDVERRVKAAVLPGVWRWIGRDRGG